MKTIKEAIMEKLVVTEKEVTPSRTPEETIGEKKVLDQNYIAREAGDYTSVSLDDIQLEPETTPEDTEISNITHTDIIHIGGQDFSVVAAKTTSEILDLIKVGKYQALSFSVDFDKVDGASIEQGIRKFKPVDNELPRGRQGTEIKGNMVVVSPSVNGFKITTLYESISESSYTKVQDLMDKIEGFQGYIIEETLKMMRDRGVPIDELVKNQAAVGVVKKARKAYETSLAEGNPIDDEIRRKSGTLASKINEEMGLMPLTGQIVEFGLQVFTVEVTNVDKGWKSARSNISYFKKGDTYGRIVRIGGCKRKVPIANEMVVSISAYMIQLIQYILPLFENLAREQLGITCLVPEGKLDKLPKNKTEDICELFQKSPEEVYGAAKELTAQATSIMRQQEKDFNVRNIATILSQFGGKKEES